VAAQNTSTCVAPQLCMTPQLLPASKLSRSASLRRIATRVFAPLKSDLKTSIDFQYLKTHAISADENGRAIRKQLLK
jgi:hypothetical protein